MQYRAYTCAYARGRLFVLSCVTDFLNQNWRRSHFLAVESQSLMPAAIDPKENHHTGLFSSLKCRGKTGNTAFLSRSRCSLGVSPIANCFWYPPFPACCGLWMAGADSEGGVEGTKEGTINNARPTSPFIWVFLPFLSLLSFAPFLSLSSTAPKSGR